MTDPHLPEQDSPPREPPAWGFRITLAAAAIYLLFRFGQVVWWGVTWVADRF